VPLGGTAQLSLKAQFANGDFKDYTAFTRWTSSNRDHLRVSMTPGERGLGYGESLGEVSVTAQLGTLSTSVIVPVSLGCVEIEILPSDAIIAYVSVALPLIVNCVLADGTKTNKTSQADFIFSAAEASIANSGDKKG